MMIIQKYNKRGSHLHLKVGQYIQVNGKEMYERDGVCKNGLMEPFMKVFGKIIKLMVKANLFMQMEIFLKESSIWIKLIILEYIHIQMVQNMKVSGKTTNKVVQVQKLGLMDPDMKEITLMGVKMEGECIHGVMDLNMTANGLITKYVDTVFTYGRTYYLYI